MLSVYPHVRFQLKPTDYIVIHHVRNLVANYRDIDALNPRAVKKVARKSK